MQGYPPGSQELSQAGHRADAALSLAVGPTWRRAWKDMEYVLNMYEYVR
jgi:hypothetical protein